MDMNFTHKPDYFFFAERFIGFLTQKVQKNPDQTQLEISFDEIQTTFQQDFAATTTNLEGILNIVDQYKVNQAPLISSHIIHSKSNYLEITLHAQALRELTDGATPIAPDPTLYG